MTNDCRVLLLLCDTSSASDPFQQSLLLAFSDETFREAKSYLSILSLIYTHSYNAQASTDMSCQTMDTRPMKERMSDAGVVQILHEGNIIKMQCPNLGTIALHSAMLLQLLQVLSSAA